MKYWFAGFFLVFFSQQVFSTTLVEAISNSIKSESKLISNFEVLESHDHQKITQSLISAFPLVQFYKQALNELSVPAYFAIIPIIESRNQRQAISSAGAVGVWQFMPQTARSYGLRVDAERDQREDIILSTRAAAQFLKHLYSRYQDPFYVLIAYNWGSGNLDRILNQNPNISISQLERRLPEETRLYIRSFVKYWSVIHSGQTRSLLDVYPDEPYFKLKDQSFCNDYLDDQVYNFLNSGNVQGKYCLVPNDRFNSHFQKIVKRNRLHVPKQVVKCQSYSRDKFMVYLVRAGDTHSSIANSLGLVDLVQLNIVGRSNLQIGSILTIPKLEHINDFKKSCGK